MLNIITEVGINYPKKLSALPKELKFIKRL